MLRIRFMSAAVLMMATAIPASANFGFLFRPRATTAYYIAVPVPVVYAPPAICVPVGNPPRLYAQPLPAPALSAKEPPLADQGKAAPVQSESKKTQMAKYFDAYAVAPAAGPPRLEGRCSVSFWNLSQQELNLKVGEKRMTLAAGRTLTLELDRQFNWQIEGRDAQTGQVADKDSALEIVIRR
jgi:hypothetical protein